MPMPQQPTDAFLELARALLTPIPPSRRPDVKELRLVMSFLPREQQHHISLICTPDEAATLLSNTQIDITDCIDLLINHGFSWDERMSMIRGDSKKWRALEKNAETKDLMIWRTQTAAAYHKWWAHTYPNEVTIALNDMKKQALASLINTSNPFLTSAQAQAILNFNPKPAQTQSALDKSSKSAPDTKPRGYHYPFAYEAMTQSHDNTIKPSEKAATAAPQTSNKGKQPAATKKGKTKQKKKSAAAKAAVDLQTTPHDLAATPSSSAAPATSATPSPHAHKSPHASHVEDGNKNAAASDPDCTCPPCIALSLDTTYPTAHFSEFAKLYPTKPSLLAAASLKLRVDHLHNIWFRTVILVRRCPCKSCSQGDMLSYSTLVRPAKEAYQKLNGELDALLEKSRITVYREWKETSDGKDWKGKPLTAGEIRMLLPDGRDQVLNVKANPGLDYNGILRDLKMT